MAIYARGEIRLGPRCSGTFGWRLDMPENAPAISRGSLIVSCQADPGTPLAAPDAIASIACAALAGGAAGIRADGPENVAAIRRRCDTLIVGSHKIRSEATAVYVTPTFEAATQVLDAGADIVGIEATDRPLADGSSTFDTIRKIKQERGAPVMADVSILTEASRARDAGADYITCAMAGFTAHSRHIEGPDWELIGEMVQGIGLPVIAEGRIWSADEAARALALGAYAVIVGTAITDPVKITRRFVGAMA